MSVKHDLLRAGILAALIGAPLAHAGGPVAIYDVATRKPYAYPNGPTIPVYTDLGKLGPVSNEAADATTAFAFAQWTDVPTSDFSAAVAGDFASIGLPDITSANANLVIGADNGGGIQVIYDDDGSIIHDFLGAPSGVLGVASPEFGGPGGTIVESWAVMNGAAIAASDTSAHQFAGVFTHELGHSIGLAHSQTNGAIIFFDDARGPAGCALPYSQALSLNNLETMYPFINPGTTGAIQATVDQRDDIVSLTNLYPGPGADRDFGGITGTIYATDGRTPLTGVNVIARNIADPYGDAVSALSGDYTQGRDPLHPDGTFTLVGLTPGAQYVVYVDGIVQGGFSTPAIKLPGAEEFWNAGESGATESDNRCEATPITTTPGSAQVANIVFNSTAEDRNFYALPVRDTIAMDISGNGRTMVGRFNGTGAPSWIWTAEEGLKLVPSVAGSIAIDKSGQRVVGNFRDSATGIVGPAFWNPDGGILPLDGLPGLCDKASGTSYDISDDGETVVGLGYRACGTASGSVFAFSWTPDGGLLDLGGSGNWRRANAVNADGRVVVGWNDVDAANSGRLGVFWKDGKQTFIRNGTAPVGEALDVNADGSVIVGLNSNRQAWRWTAATGAVGLGVLPVPGLPPQRVTGAANLVSDDGNLVFGTSGFALQREVSMWTPQLGLVNFGRFLHDQGFDVVADWIFSGVGAMSANSKTLVGFGLGPLGMQAFKVDLNKVAVCVNPHSTKPKTLEVGFPGGMNDQLARGALPGRCERILQ